MVRHVFAAKIHLTVFKGIKARPVAVLTGSQSSRSRRLPPLQLCLLVGRWTKIALRMAALVSCRDISPLRPPTHLPTVLQTVHLVATPLRGYRTATNATAPTRTLALHPRSPQATARRLALATSHRRAVAAGAWRPTSPLPLLLPLPPQPGRSPTPA